MVNQNNYEVKFNPGFTIKIFTDDYEREYFTCVNQLVSILHIDPLTGHLKICRGRVSDYVIQRFDAETIKGREIPERKLIKLTIDTSRKGKSSSETITITNILEIHSIDWRYSNIEDSDKYLSFEDWYELNKMVSAPSATREDRLNASKGNV